MTLPLHSTVMCDSFGRLYSATHFWDSFVRLICATHLCDSFVQLITATHFCDSFLRLICATYFCDSFLNGILKQLWIQPLTWPFWYFRNAFSISGICWGIAHKILCLQPISWKFSNVEFLLEGVFIIADQWKIFEIRDTRSHVNFIPHGCFKNSFFFQTLNSQSMTHTLIGLNPSTI